MSAVLRIRAIAASILVAGCLVAPSWAADSPEPRAEPSPSASTADPSAGGGPDAAADRAAERSERDRRERLAPLSIYVPPVPRGSATRKSGGGTRTAAAGPDAMPGVQVLAPLDHEGRAADPQPTLYWYLDRPTELRTEFTLIDEDSEEPLVEVELPGPHAAGVHGIELSAHGARLEPGIRYVWFVSLVPDPEHRSRDVNDGAPIRRSTEEAAGYEAQARAGLWYDALDSLARGAREDARLAELRAAMLRAEGLERAAAWRGRW